MLGHLRALRAVGDRVTSGSVAFAFLLAAVVPAAFAPPAAALGAPTITNVVSAGARQVTIYFLPSADVTGAVTYQYSSDGGTSWQTRQDNSTSIASPIVTTNTSANGNGDWPEFR